jgi:hypothetical protein
MSMRWFVHYHRGSKHSGLKSPLFPFMVVMVLPIDHIGTGALSIDNTMVSLQPWDLIIGSNGHVCVAWKFVDVINFSNLFPIARPDDGLMTGPPWARGGDAFFTSYQVTKMHTTIVNWNEYQQTFEPERIRLAREWLKDVGNSIALSPPGLSGYGVGGIVSLSTIHLSHLGHSECFNFSRAIPPPMGPCRQREVYIAQFQDRLHALLDGLRLILGFSTIKSDYHLSIRRR